MLDTQETKIDDMLATTISIDVMCEKVQENHDEETE